MITLYEASQGFSWSVKEIQATRKTDSRYYYLGHRGKETWSNLVSNYSRVFDTREGAIDWMRSEVTRKLEGAKSALSLAENEVLKFNEKYPQ